jgi:AraC-like DNA-binding protein
MSAAQALRIKTSLQFIQEKYNEAHPFRDEILKNQIVSFLFEVEAVFEVQRAEVHQGRTRSEQLTAEFKQLVNLHFKKERNLQFYAAQLCITSKHLSETVRAVTGKTGSEWISKAVILEAKVLLQSPELSIAQISDLLHFNDQSTFGKFFKNQTGMSPAAYKQTL